MAGRGVGRLRSAEEHCQHGLRVPPDLLRAEGASQGYDDDQRKQHGDEAEHQNDADTPRISDRTDGRGQPGEADDDVLQRLTPGQLAGEPGARAGYQGRVNPTISNQIPGGLAELVEPSFDSAIGATEVGGHFSGRKPVLQAFADSLQLRRLLPGLLEQELYGLLPTEPQFRVVCELVMSMRGKAGAQLQDGQALPASSGAPVAEFRPERLDARADEITLEATACVGIPAAGLQACLESRFRALDGRQR